MFWLPFLGAISPKSLANKQSRAVFAFVCIVLAIFIGLRDQVGGDWGAYVNELGSVGSLPLSDAIEEIKDPGYVFVNWLVAQLGGDIYIVNLTCAAIMMAGVFRFCRSLPNPWLALLVAVPYMLVVVGMGYTRQAVALGLVMFGLVSLGKGRTFSFVLCVVFGALFHSSAVLLVAIAGVASTQKRIWTLIWGAATFVLAYLVLFRSQSDDLWKNYVTADMQSYGAIERVMMNVVPALLLLIYRRRFAEDLQVRRVWIIFCWLAVGSLPLVFLASTAVDRMALYLLPLQLFVFSRMPNLTRNATVRTAIVIGTVIYYAAVQVVWLNFAVYRYFWLPYHFMPLGE
jgi:hypothetical protein